MPIVFEARYSKKLGLPGYSSHEFAVSVRTELNDLTSIAPESERLYGMLQAAVDREIQKSGFLPEAAHKNGNGRPPNGNGTPPTNGASDVWNCSEKQRNLIEQIVAEHHLDKNAVDALAKELFGKSVRALNKLEASGLIEELFRQNGTKGSNGGRVTRGTPR
jgi:hypothetical protein